jgi:site-specific recombinase XerC
MAIADAPVDVAIMLSLMADGGLRCCEVAVLDWGQVDLAESRMQFVGKGGHERVVGMPERLIRTLARSSSTSGPVVGRKLTAGRISQIVSVHLRAAGVGATGHQLRHLYATRMIVQTNGNLQAVQQSLGHASVTSTEIYTLVDPRIALEAARSL